MDDNLSLNILHASPTTFAIEHRDCLEGMSEIPPHSVDLVVTSPPYNLGIRYSKYQDDQTREQYLAWCLEWGAAIRRVLKKHGSLFLNIGASPSNPLLPHEIALLFGKNLFQLQNTIHWIKSITLDAAAGEPAVTRGHFKPINSARFLNDCHETIFHFTPNGDTPIDRLAIGVPYADKSNIARWAHTAGTSRDQRCRGNTWFIPYRTIKSRAKERPHPASFPTALAEKCILLHGNATELTLLDPFLGIGSSAIAAQKLGVKHFIGFDIDAEYLQIAEDRLGISSPS